MFSTENIGENGLTKNDNLNIILKNKESSSSSLVQDDRFSVCKENTVTTLINNNLQNTPLQELTKNCPNDATNMDNNGAIPNQQNTELAAAIVAINNLPLSAEEKANIIRQLYNKDKG